MHWTGPLRPGDLELVVVWNWDSECLRVLNVTGGRDFVDPGPTGLAVTGSN